MYTIRSFVYCAPNLYVFRFKRENSYKIDSIYFLKTKKSQFPMI